MTEIKGKNERITFNFRPDAKIDPRKIPDFLKKHKDELSFTAYGNPFFTYKYKKTGLVETDAELLMGRTEELLEEMKELVLETEPVQNNYQNRERKDSDKEVFFMKGYVTASGYMGYVENEYILFASEDDYFEYVDSLNF